MAIDWNDAINIPSMEIRSDVIKDWFNDATVELAKFDNFDRAWKSSDLAMIYTIKKTINSSKELHKKVQRIDNLRIRI